MSSSGRMTAGTIRHGLHGEARGLSLGLGVIGLTIHHGTTHGTAGVIHGIPDIGTPGTGTHGIGIPGTGIHGIILITIITTRITGMTTGGRDCLPTAGISMARGSLRKAADLQCHVLELAAI